MRSTAEVVGSRGMDGRQSAPLERLKDLQGSAGDEHEPLALRPKASKVAPGHLQRRPMKGKGSESMDLRGRQGDEISRLEVVEPSVSLEVVGHL